MERWKCRNALWEGELSACTSELPIINISERAALVSAPQGKNSKLQLELNKSHLAPKSDFPTSTFRSQRWAEEILVTAKEVIFGSEINFPASLEPNSTIESTRALSNP